MSEFILPDFRNILHLQYMEKLQTLMDRQNSKLFLVTSLRSLSNLVQVAGEVRKNHLILGNR